MTKLGNAIRKARIRKGLSINKMAEILKISVGAMFNYENGKTVPRADLLKNIEKCTDLKACQLCRKVGQK